MPVDLQEWLDDHSGHGVHWYSKRLSGNDMLANATHQAGPYLPKQFLFGLFPGLKKPEKLNPDARFDLYIGSHNDHRRVRAVWYNNKLHSGTRNEIRVTGLGGSASALLDPENTGALVLFAFLESTPSKEPVCNVWVCRDETEENLIEDRIGPVEPGEAVSARNDATLMQVELWVWGTYFLHSKRVKATYRPAVRRSTSTAGISPPLSSCHSMSISVAYPARSTSRASC